MTNELRPTHETDSFKQSEYWIRFFKSGGWLLSWILSMAVIYFFVWQTFRPVWFVLGLALSGLIGVAAFVIREWKWLRPRFRVPRRTS